MSRFLFDLPHSRDELIILYAASFPESRSRCFYASVMFHSSSVGIVLEKRIRFFYP